MASKKTRIPEERIENMEELAACLQPVAQRLDLHGEMLKRILQILTEEKESDGPSLYELLADLIKRLDIQSHYLKDLTIAVGKLGIELPLDLVRAIDDNLDIPHRINGHTNGSSGADPS